jgi:hypothetical protein
MTSSDAAGSSRVKPSLSVEGAASRLDLADADEEVGVRVVAAMRHLDDRDADDLHRLGQDRPGEGRACPGCTPRSIATSRVRPGPVLWLSAQAVWSHGSPGKWEEIPGPSHALDSAGEHYSNRYSNAV